MLDKINEIVDLIKEYGFIYGLIVVLTSVSFRLFPDGKINHKFNNYKYKLVSNYLNKYYSDVIKRYKNIDRMKEKTNNLKTSKIIWLFWWQGENEAPKVVKACINSVKKNAGNNKVIILNKDNYLDYIRIPVNIIKKVKQHKISITHLSDILRFCLLAEYGGIWIDSTVFVNDNLNDVTNYDFYTVKHGLFSDWHVSRGLWSTFFLESKKSNVGIQLVRDILIEYAQNEKRWMAYLLTDAVIGIAYDNIPSFKMQVDDVPWNNSEVFNMYDELNLDVSLFKIPSKINKLTYKFDETKYRKSKNSAYYYLINNKLK